MAKELSNQELLDKLHAFFKKYNHEHMKSSEAADFYKELDKIMHDAIKSWGLDKTTRFAEKYAQEFGKYDINIDHLKMSDVTENTYFSWLFPSIERRRKELYKKSTKSLEEKFGISGERKHGVRTMNGIYVSGPYLLKEKHKEK